MTSMVAILRRLYILPVILTFALALCGLSTQAHAQWLDLFSDPATTFTPPTPSLRDAVNSQLDEEILFWRAQANAWQNRLNQNQAQLQRLQDNEADLQAHILALEGNVHTYRVLQEQKSALPVVVSVPGLAEAIAGIRLRQFEVNQLQRQLELAQSTTERIRLVTTLQDQLNQTLNIGVQLQQSQRDLELISDRLRTSLRDELFWVPSNPILGISWWLGLPQRLYHQVVAEAQTARVRFKWPALSSLGSLLAVLLLGFAGLIGWGRKPLQDKMHALNVPVVKYQQARDEQARATHYARAYPPLDDDDPLPAPVDEGAGPPAQPLPQAGIPSPWCTPGVMALLALLSAPPSLVLLALGAWLTPETTTDRLSVGPVLMALAFSLFVLQFLHAVLKHPDLCPVHFRWSPDAQHHLLKFLRRFTWVLLPTTVILAVAQQQTVGLTTDNLGVLVLVFAGLAIAYLFRRLLRRLPEVRRRVPLYWALNALLVFLPLVLVVLTAAGYYYTSLQLTARLLATFYVLTGWVLAEVTVMRGVDLATEKLRRQRAEEEAAFLAVSVQQQETTGRVSAPLPKLDLAQVTQQSLRLAQFLILLVFGGLMYWVWADLVGVLAGLNEWAVWQEAASADAATASSLISLLDIFSAIIIVLLTFFFATNLPGLLEMTILSRLSLQQGSAYAITTLLNYIITAIGLVMALSALGVSWDKLQWLVAALSVGLGFGLQEIFANFVSGLIILFERPIRIGDVVTLGNLSGTVRQIRIRATTITEFDRKDIIVPNKTFVTGQLINWSLSDTVTRVIVRVGVAYGSDLEKTKALLTEAAMTNSRVLADPEPQVLFLNFGASSLDHELRIHVKELSDRNPVIDEINRFIDRKFKAAGIEIAFQQVDIRLRNSEGLERIIETKPGPAAS